MTLAVSGPREPRELYFLADRNVKSVIESASGVGEVTIQGATDRAVQIDIDAQRLAAHRLSIMQVHEAIVGQNAEIPGGRVDTGYRELTPPHAGADGPTRRRSTTWSSPPSTARPIRIDDLGEAPLTPQKEVRTRGPLRRPARRGAGSAAAVGREHGGGHRRGQASASTRRGSCCRRM